MSSQTVYVVQGFEKRGKALRPAVPQSMRSADQARDRAVKDARRFVGVIAFQQTVDSETGEILVDPVIISRHGELPRELSGDD